MEAYEAWNRSAEVAFIKVLYESRPYKFLY
jgi:hypothetical protein